MDAILESQEKGRIGGRMHILNEVEQRYLEKELSLVYALSPSLSVSLSVCLSFFCMCVREKEREKEREILVLM